MWLNRQVETVIGAVRPVAFLGGEPYGVPFVIDALRERERVAWCRLGPRADGDPVAQGNALARAVNDALGDALLPLALPFRAHLQALGRHSVDVLPLRIALTATAPHLTLIDGLLDLQHVGFGVVLDLRHPAAHDLARERCLVVGHDDLAVRAAEARAALPGGLPDDVVEAMLASSGGRFGHLLSESHRVAGLPRVLVPDPAGALVDAAEAEAVEPALVLQALRRDGDVVGALELAVLRVPHAVDDVLRQAGPRYQEEGLLARLHVLLSAVPEPYALRERVLEWRLVAALAVGDLASTLTDVDAHLRAHAAPALRARRAGTLPHGRGFAEAEAAVGSARTPLTLWQYGRLHPHPQRALELLRESVQVAEDLGSRFEVVRNATTFAARLLHVGEFARAAAWARWALDVFDQEQLRDGARRLTLVNDVAVARIMSGDLAGLRGTLEDAQAMVEGSLPDVATLLRSTLAYLELAEGRTAAALALLEATYHGSPRRMRARYAYQLVRVLVELGRHDVAATVAADALEIGSAGEPHERLQGLLARGIARACAGDPGASDDLVEVLMAHGQVMEQRLCAALHYLLASGGAAHNLPADVADALRALHPIGLRVLSGPVERFEAVWSTLMRPSAHLEFAFLGRTSCRYRGDAVTLPPRLSEAALALALHPEGISREQLNAFLTPEGQPPFTPGGMRGMLTRLRVLLPVSDAPYRFTVPYRADVLEARTLLAAGQVREAVTLLRGRLLPDSEAPGIEEQRLVLEEELRQAALQAADPDALFDLAERLVDDIECWEATAAALAAGDPRLALARARVRRLEREDAHAHEARREPARASVD